ncbi:MAG: homogentisate phytyltransferase [Elainellaceae cyanobacterium]
MSRLTESNPSPTSNTSGYRAFFHRYTAWLYALWKFSRPHTIIGTTLSMVSLYTIAIALASTSLAQAFSTTVPDLFIAWLACLCGNIYIVGLNQTQDVEIDRINKPHLPIASGEFSLRTGWLIVLITGAIALVIPPFQSVALTATVWISLAIGTAYSLPPIRLKRHPLWASLCIFTVRGVVVNLGLFAHFYARLGEPFAVPTAIWILTLFVLVFTFAIAIFKDIPDLEGDRRYNITTFTVQLGPQAVFNLTLWVLTACYSGMMLTSLVLPTLNLGVILISHSFILVLLWVKSTKVDLSNTVAIAQFYQFIWKLFFLEYLLFPIACFTASSS